MTSSTVGSALCLAVLACGDVPSPEPAPEALAEPAVEAAPTDEPAAPDRTALRERARLVFRTLPDEATATDNPITEEKISLGRMLYYDTRLSKNHDVACNSCHPLDRFGVDGEPTSPGHRAQRGDRNSPSVYNASLHVAQFWDGRAADVEEQAKGPVLNPIEMAMPGEEATVAVLKSIPGYAPLFAAAFPEDADPVSYDNMANAIGAFERRLLTPSRFDAFVEGRDEAYSDEEVAGLARFIGTGCNFCHNGPAIGGGSFQKLGVIEPYATEDPGRFKVTGNEADRQVFKVPSLRNVEKTGPWLHDGSVTSLDQMVRIMGAHQLGQTLSDEQVASILVFLASLTGEVDAEYIAMPELPASGPDTPKPDPS